MGERGDARSTGADGEVDAALGTWADVPIASATGDRFDMHRVAQAVAARIDACAPGQESTVFGLVGRWGSGKSSILAMVREELATKDWLVGVFSPWSAPDSQGLEYEFLAALNHVLAENEPEDRERAVAALAKLGSALLPLSRLVPVAGDALHDYMDAGLKILTERKPWHVLHRELATALAEQPHRILIVADDVDRLDSAELLEFLKVVRLVGRLPNVHHLLAYDIAMVEELLAQQGFVGGGGAFVEKIVQHPFVLPPMSNAKRRELAEITVSAVLSTYGVHLDEHNAGRANELVGILAELLETPRDHLRFREHVLSEARLIAASEVDVLDLIAVSYLRFGQRRLLERIEDFIEPQQVEPWTPGYGQGDPAPVDFDAMVKRYTPDRNASSTLKLLSFLVPQIAWQGLTYRLDHERAFSDEAYRQRYLLLGVPADDVPDAVVQGAFDDLLAGALGTAAVQLLAELLDDVDSSQSAVALTKATELRSRAATTTEQLLEFALDRLVHSVEATSGQGFGAQGIWPFAAREAARAYELAISDTARLEARLGRQTTLQLLRAVNRYAKRPEGAETPLVVDAANHYLAAIRADPGAQLGPQGTLRFMLDLIATVLGLDTIAGVLDEYVGADDSRFEDVALAFVEEQRWVGGADVEIELHFSGALFGAALSAGVRTSHAAQVSHAKELRELSSEDTSEENKKAIALAGAKAILDQEEPHAV